VRIGSILLTVAHVRNLQVFPYVSLKISFLVKARSTPQQDTPQPYPNPPL
jgi:hypothetical protein